jgi:hypothetical protein
MIYGMSEFEDRLREIAKEISRTVERNIDQVAETFGVDADRAREVADAAGQWLNDHVEGGEGLFGNDRRRAAEADRPVKPESAPGEDPAKRSTRPGPHPLDLPTSPQGLALSALDSGRWTVRPGSNLLASTGEGPAPVDAAERVSELRARDWIKADGELTLVGRRALERWADAAAARPREPTAPPAAAPHADAPATDAPATDAPPADPS